MPPNMTQPLNGALAKRDQPREQISGTYHEPEAVDHALARASARAHLITPFPACGALPPGFGVRLSAIKIDPRTETYPLQGKVGLSKVALDRISHALGISWDPRLTGRLDDGRDPRYCRYRVVGSYLGPDGIRHYVQGEKELDLRDGSPTVEALEAQQRKRGKDATSQVREMRQHIQSHAETKARLRAIRSMGVRTSYDEVELAKPFVAAQVTFTGQTDDPELRREFARAVAAHALSATSHLYGPAVPATEPPRLPAPPVGTVEDDLDDEDAGASDDDVGTEGERFDAADYPDDYPT